VLDDRRSGGFARTFQAEAEAGAPALELISAMTAGNDPMTRAEEAVRAALNSLDSDAASN
jgi:hypothetical protein